MSKKSINRRDFLKTASLGLAGGYAALKTGFVWGGMMGGGGGGGCGGGGGGGVIDPPSLAPFKDPLDLPLLRDGNLVTANLQVGITPINVNGTMANLMTYKGCFPAPTITVRKNDLVTVNLTNSLPYTTDTNLLGHRKNLTNLHTHGWHVSPKPFADYVMYALEPGQSFEHVYDLSFQEAGSFNFYHPHLHGVSAEQYWAGLVGALVTEDDDPDHPRPGWISFLNGIKTHIMILKDLSLSGSEPAPHATMMDYMHGMEGNTVMVNGQVNPYLTVQPGEIRRWRILNASNARWYKLSLSGHSMHLVATDGHLLNKPWPRTQILLSPGERVDVLVKASTTTGKYKLLALPYSRMGMMTSPQITLLTLDVKGTRKSGSIPASIDSTITRLALDPGPLPHRTLALSMGQGRGYINGISFTDMDHAYKITSMVGDDMMPSYEVWTITNQSGMDHPFHQHVDAAQVLAVSGADSSYPLYATMPAWKDTVLIPKMGSATLLVPVMHYDGMTMFHCHILEHEDIGMMGVWDRMPMEM